MDRVIAAIARDKKANAEGLGFVLCQAPGRIDIGARLDEGSVRAAVQELIDG